VADGQDFLSGTERVFLGQVEVGHVALDVQERQVAHAVRPDVLGFVRPLQLRFGRGETYADVLFEFQVNDVGVGGEDVVLEHETGAVAEFSLDAGDRRTALLYHFLPVRRGRRAGCGWFDLAGRLRYVLFHRVDQLVRRRIGGYHRQVVGRVRAEL